jgi:OOP family OmpA-OmpF porin
MKGRSAKRLVTLAAAFGLASATASALAQQASPWYAGVSAGQSKVSIDDDVLQIGGATSTSLSKDESGTGYKVYGGYQINRNVAVEGGYADLGSFSATRTVTAPASGSVKADIKASGWNLDIVGIWPFTNRFSVFGRFGGFYNELKTSITSSGAVVITGGDTNPKKSKLSWKYGFGAGWDFTDRLGARIEFESYRDLGDDSTGKGDVNLFSIGMLVRF